MSETQKKGILSKLFGSKQSCCCNVKIEEVVEEQPKEVKEQQDQPSAKNDQKPGDSCCGGR